MGRLIFILGLLSTGIALGSDTTKVTEVPKAVTKKAFFNINSERVIVLEGPVGEANMKALSDQLRDIAAASVLTPAYLEINSGGGSVVAGIQFIETMRDLKIHRGLKTICIVRNSAYSMAAVIAMYCHETYMLTFSDMMFHGASYGVSGNADEVLSRVLHLTRWLTKMETELAIQMGINYIKFRQRRGRELWLTAREAARYGFVDGVATTFFHEAEPPLMIPFIIRHSGKDDGSDEDDYEEAKRDLTYSAD